MNSVGLEAGEDGQDSGEDKAQEEDRDCKVEKWGHWGFPFDSMYMGMTRQSSRGGGKES